MTYREEVARTAGFLPDQKANLSMGALGLAGEAGEVADMLKKHLYHNKPLDRNELIKELGDVRWYLEFLLLVTGVSMETVENINVEKLRKRYPSGFSYKDAAERKDENE